MHGFGVLMVQDSFGYAQDALIIGAGRIGRSFLAELFSNAGFALHFVDINHQLIDSLNAQKQYTIFKTAKGQTTRTVISGYQAYYREQEGEICEMLAERDVVVAVCVPADSISDVAQMLAIGIAARALVSPEKPLNILMCVNMDAPALSFKDALETMLGGNAASYLNQMVGIADTVVWCSAPDTPKPFLEQDPCAVANNGWPGIYIDARAFKGAPIQGEGFIYCYNISEEEIKKIYTFNMADGVLAYVGAAHGYDSAADAFCSQQVKKVLVGALEESAYGLCNQFGFDSRDIKKLTEQVLENLDNSALGDTIARLGGDTARKLSPAGRLVGSATFCYKAGKMPYNLIKAIACGFLFDGSDDPGTMRTLDTIKRLGIVSALELISGIDIKHPLQGAILEAYYNVKDNLNKNPKGSLNA